MPFPRCSWGDFIGCIRTTADKHLYILSPMRHTVRFSIIIICSPLKICPPNKTCPKFQRDRIFRLSFQMESSSIFLLTRNSQRPSAKEIWRRPAIRAGRFGYESLSEGSGGGPYFIHLAVMQPKDLRFLISKGANVNVNAFVLCQHSRNEWAAAAAVF